MKKVFKIIATSSLGTEIIDEAETEKEAKYLVNEYQLAYGLKFYIWYK
jgi:hypothetical protein